MGKGDLFIGVTLPNGELLIQPYKEWLTEEKNLKILNRAYGSELGDILMGLGDIQMEDGEFVFKYVQSADPRETALRLLGDIAEAVIVKRCRESPRINRKWAKYARKGERKTSKLDRYKAVATSHPSTKREFSFKYNPSDTQRDILWIKSDEPKRELMQPQNTGIRAGLQIKVSSDGKGYILNDLIFQRYEVPLVYFGLNNDFQEIADELYKQKENIEIGKDFINGKKIDYECFKCLEYYFPLVKGLIEGEIEPIDLLENREIMEDDISGPAVTKSIIETVSNPPETVFE